MDGVKSFLWLSATAKEDTFIAIHFTVEAILILVCFYVRTYVSGKVEHLFIKVSRHAYMHTCKTVVDLHLVAICLLICGQLLVVVGYYRLIQ